MRVITDAISLDSTVTTGVGYHIDVPLCTQWNKLYSENWPSCSYLTCSCPALITSFIFKKRIPLVLVTRCFKGLYRLNTGHPFLTSIFCRCPWPATMTDSNNWPSAHWLHIVLVLFSAAAVFVTYPALSSRVPTSCLAITEFVPCNAADPKFCCDFCCANITDGLFFQVLKLLTSPPLST